MGPNKFQLDSWNLLAAPGFLENEPLTLNERVNRDSIEVDQIKAQEQEAREAEESERRRAVLCGISRQQGGGRRFKNLVDFPFNADGMIGQNIAIGKCVMRHKKY